MRFYIATGLSNAERAKTLAGVLTRNGHEFTYNWTEHGDIRSEGEDRMTEVAFSEVRAVRDAEMFIALLPGGCGTHTEIGIAIADLDLLTIGLVMDMWTEKGNDGATYDKVASQEDFDRF